MASGEIYARFGLRNGQTRLLEHRQNAPLKIARTFVNPTRCGALEICVMDASPGLLAGDSHRYEWVLEAGAQVRVIAQGATRVHPARPTAEPASPARVSRQNISARVAAGARLELWPEAIIPFRDAAFASQTEIHLEDDAQVAFFECLSAGRIAHGEKFEFERVSLRTRVFDAHGPRFCAQTRFVPAELNPCDGLVFGEWSQWATLVAFGDNIGFRNAQKAQEILREALHYGAASLLSRGGIAVSLLGARAHDARRVALEIEAAWKKQDVSRETNRDDDIF